MPRVTHMQNNTTMLDSRNVEYTQPRAPRSSTQTNTQAQRPRAAATRRHCTSSPTCHETAPQPLLNLLRLATAAARLLLLTAAATVQCRAVPHTATPQHRNTATQRHSDTPRSLPHTAARGNQRATYTQTPKHTAAATHTATLHTQRARHQGSNTRRQRGSAHPPTTASSSV